MQSFHNQHAAVLGLGASGESAARLLLRQGARVTVLDSDPAASTGPRAEALRSAGIAVLSGPEAETAGTHEAFEFAVISPGIDPAVPLVRSLSGRGVPLLAEIELAFGFCRCPVVAITGTNGKTTTTGLLVSMLEQAGLRVKPGGNYGTPFCDLVEASADLDWIALEVSSFQLEEIRAFHPKISVWLNLTPDHLDRYPDMDSYRTAKLRVFENQTREDSAVVNAADSLPDIAAGRITFSTGPGAADFTLSGNVISFRGVPVLDMASTHLSGIHNAENLMAALGVARAMDLPFDRAVPGLCTFRPARHRCELAGVLDGVSWLNDSKATNLDAVEKALRSQTAPVILIAGGKDKGYGFEPLAGAVAGKVRHAVLIGEMRPRIRTAWEGHVPCHEADTLADAVTTARSLARPGEVVLFSPGTSSFDMFKNYADRGDQFCALVKSSTSLHSTTP